jgi:hypothetical protein
MKKTLEKILIKILKIIKISKKNYNLNVLIVKGSAKKIF